MSIPSYKSIVLDPERIYSGSTGDVLHFGLAKEQFSVSHPKEETRLLIVGDDVAVSRTQGAVTGRRGLAGTVLVHKVAGASAARGDALDTVYDVAANIASRVGTIGCGLGHCSLPGSTSSSHDGSLGSDEIEIGMGAWQLAQSDLHNALQSS